MALELSMEYTITSVGQNIIVTDETVYGVGDDPTREDSLVNFIVTDKRTGELIEVTYDEETVEEILIPITHDGWYNILMTVTNNGDEVERSDEKNLDILVTERFCECLAIYTDKLTEKMCGCEDKKVWESIFYMKGQLIGIEKLVENNDMLSADMAIERLGLECQRLKKDCGC